MLHVALALALSPLMPTQIGPAQTAVGWVAKFATAVRATPIKDLVPIATEILIGNSRRSLPNEIVEVLRDQTTQSAPAAIPK